MQLRLPCQHFHSSVCNLQVPVLLFLQYKYSYGWFRLRSHHEVRLFQIPNPYKSVLLFHFHHLSDLPALPLCLHQNMDLTAILGIFPCTPSLYLLKIISSLYYTTCVYKWKENIFSMSAIFPSVCDTQIFNFSVFFWGTHALLEW